MVLPAGRLLPAPELAAHEPLALSPLKWKQTLQPNDVCASLEANPFRRLTLDTRD